ELAEEFAAALGHGLAEIALVIREVQKRRGSGKLLALEQHRRVGGQQRQRRHRPEAARTGQLVTAQAAAGVGDLVVVLQENDKGAGRQVQGRRAARLLLPGVTLPLKEITVLERRDELL